VFILTFDEASTSDGSGCCGMNSGGGGVATVLLSGLIAPGTTSDRDYNHYSILRTAEDGLSLGEHLGSAADPKVASVTDVWKESRSPQPGR
jgi:hypothetical protein